jgi:hypothetical protein
VQDLIARILGNDKPTVSPTGSTTARKPRPFPIGDPPCSHSRSFVVVVRRPAYGRNNTFTMPSCFFWNVA